VFVSDGCYHQGIYQGFTVVCLAQGRVAAVTWEWSTRVTAAPTSITFSGSDTKDGIVTMPEQDGV
jgi:hypothetical protein